MKKILTEQRLCELAGLREADTPTKQMYRVGDGKYKTLKKGIDVGPTGTLDMELDPEKVVSAAEPEDPDATAKLPTAGDESPEGGTGSNYRESERLFRHFFGHLDKPTLEIMMHNDDEMEDIVVQLYGWQLPDYKRNYDEPGADTIRIAQQFEKEGKKIEGNETEFMKRLSSDQYTRGKAEFDKTPNAQPEAIAQDYALKRLVKEKDLTPLDAVTPAKVKQYQYFLMKKYADEYERLFQGYLKTALKE
jgi:hypothetical protein